MVYCIHITAYVAIPREKEKKKVVGNSEKRKSTDRSSLKSAFTYPTHLSRYSGALSLLFLPQSERLNKYMPNSPSQLPFTVSERLERRRRKNLRKKEEPYMGIHKKKVKKKNKKNQIPAPITITLSLVHPRYILRGEDSREMGWREMKMAYASRIYKQKSPGSDSRTGLALRARLHII